LPVKPWEKHSVNGETVRVKRHGHCYIEVLTSDRKGELQQEIREAVANASYTADTEPVEGGNFRCQLLPTKGSSFSELINKIVDLIVRRIERYEKKSRKKTVSTQSTTSRKVSTPAKRIPNYRLPAGRVITT
jgi:hypothetical protein